MVIVVAVLATVAIPQYIRAVERGKGAKVKNVIESVIRAEVMYAAEHGKFTNNLADLNEYVEIGDLSKDSDWTYILGTPLPMYYYLTAMRKSGICKDCFLRVIYTSSKGNRYFMGKLGKNMSPGYDWPSSKWCR